MSRLLEHPSSLSLRLMRTNAWSNKILRSFTYPGEKGLWWAHANQYKTKELRFWQMTRWMFHLLLLCVSWFLESVFNCMWSKLKPKYINIQLCDIRNFKLPGNKIWTSFEENPDNFTLLHDLSTLRSKENEHQGKGYGGGGGHASEDVPGQTAKMPQLWCYRTYWKVRGGVK